MLPALLSEDLVLPGHDPLVLERLKRVGDGIVELYPDGGR